MIEVNEPWWQVAWRSLCDRWESSGYDSLTDDEKVWLNARSIIDATEDGGVVSFYYNSGADTLQDTLLALKLLEAADIADQLERVSRLFGVAVPATVEERNAVIERWDDDPAVSNLLDEVDPEILPKFDQLELTLEQFIRQRGLVRGV